MLYWVVSAAAIVLLGTVTVVVLRGDDAVPAAPVTAPPWLLPEPGALAGTSFPLRWQGYDPDHVEAVVGALVVAYESLYTAADDATRHAAAVAAAARRGLAPPEEGPHETAPPAPPAVADAPPPGTAGGDPVT